MKIVILSSLSWSLVNFRGALIARMAAEGHEVVACAPDAEPEVIATLARAGVRFRLTPMARAGTNPLRDLTTLAGYARLMRAERPDFRPPPSTGACGSHWPTDKTTKSCV